MDKIAAFVQYAGGTHLRGGVFRAGTYPGEKFGWIDKIEIQKYSDIAKKYNLKNIIEVLDYTDKSLDMIAPYCDVFQVGARSMQNYSLLRRLGEFGKPVFLKRHVGCTVDEWLGAAEHLLVGGVKELALIERGSSTFHNDVRWTPCVHVIPSVKSICNIPVIFDASHSVGRRDLVKPMALAGTAAGAGGILIETHFEPEKSLSDADQAVSVDDYIKIIDRVKFLRRVMCVA